jgi:hypothetical protein
VSFLADDHEVVEAVRAAIDAGVPRATIGRELELAFEGPDDELAPIVLAGRLRRQARLQRHGPSPLSADA